MTSLWYDLWENRVEELLQLPKETILCLLTISKKYEKWYSPLHSEDGVPQINIIEFLNSLDLKNVQSYEKHLEAAKDLL